MIADGSKLDPKTDRWSRNLPCAAASLFGETGIKKFIEAAGNSLHARLVWPSRWRICFVVSCDGLRGSRPDRLQHRRSAVDPCRARKLIKLRYAVLSGLVGRLVVAIAIAHGKRGERQCDDNGSKSHRYLGRHGHFLPCWKHIAFADWMGQRGDIPGLALEHDFAWSASVRLLARRKPIASLDRALRNGSGSSSKSAGYQRPIAYWGSNQRRRWPALWRAVFRRSNTDGALLI
jgi:hypothetical protein